MKLTKVLLSIFIVTSLLSCSSKDNSDPSTLPSGGATPDTTTQGPSVTLSTSEALQALDITVATLVNQPKIISLKETNVSFKVKSYPKHGEITGKFPNLTYTPAKDFKGNDSFKYEARKGAEIDTGTIYIRVYSNDSAVQASAFKMTLDIQQKIIKGEWKKLAKTDATKALITQQGSYGTFTIKDKFLIYKKLIETKQVDTALLELDKGGKKTEILITIKPLYWTQMDSKYKTLAIKSDGTLWRFSEGSKPTQEVTKAINWKSISIGYFPSFALKADGTLWKLSRSSSVSLFDAVREGTATDWSSVAAGYSHVAAIKSNGTLWIKPKYYNDDWFQEPTLATDWVEVSAGAGFTAALKRDGTLWSWGRNDMGQMGDSTKIGKKNPTQEATLSHNWQTISAGEYHTIALKTDGTLWSWGFNRMGENSEDAFAKSLTPFQEKSHATDWVSISAGDVHSVAIKKNGTLWGWGFNDYSQVGDGTTTNRGLMVQEATKSTRWEFASAGSRHTYLQKTDGTLWSFGKKNKIIKKPKQEISKAKDWRSVTIGWNYTVAIKENGTLWAWGNNSYGQLGIGTTKNEFKQQQESTKSTNWKVAQGGKYSTMAIRDDGTLWVWGSAGKVNNKTNIVKIPTQEITASKEWKRFENGYVVKNDNSLWRLNSENQESTTPVFNKVNIFVDNWKGYASYFSSSSHAIKNNGTLWGIGNNRGYGVLATGNTESSLEPIQEITQANDWSKIYRASYFAMALKDDGTLWGWGWNKHGQLGDGTTSDKYIPIQESTYSSWDDVVLGYKSTLALKSDGTIWSWGRDISTPQQELSKSNEWKSLAHSTNIFKMFVMALKNDGSLWGWGVNGSSQIYPLVGKAQRVQTRK